MNPLVCSHRHIWMLRLLTLVVYMPSVECSAEPIKPKWEESGPTGNAQIQLHEPEKRSGDDAQWEFRVADKSTGREISPLVSRDSYPIAKAEHLFVWGPAQQTLVAISNRGKFFDAAIWKLKEDTGKYEQVSVLPEPNGATIRAMMMAWHPNEKGLRTFNSRFELGEGDLKNVSGRIVVAVESSTDEVTVAILVKFNFASNSFDVTGGEIRDFRGKLLFSLDSGRMKEMLEAKP